MESWKLHFDFIQFAFKVSENRKLNETLPHLLLDEIELLLIIYQNSPSVVQRLTNQLSSNNKNGDLESDW